MYHSIAFEPYSQVTDTSSEFYNSINVNPGGQNQRLPAKGTIKRKFYSGMKRGELANEIYQYDIPADSIAIAARVLINPLPLSPKTVDDHPQAYE